MVLIKNLTIHFPSKKKSEQVAALHESKEKSNHLTWQSDLERLQCHPELHIYHTLALCKLKSYASGWFGARVPCDLSTTELAVKLSSKMYMVQALTIHCDEDKSLKWKLASFLVGFNEWHLGTVFIQRILLNSWRNTQPKGSILYE